MTPEEKLQELISGSNNIVFFGGRRRIDGERHSGFPQRGWPVSSEIRLSAGGNFEPFLFPVSYGRILPVLQR